MIKLNLDYADTLEFQHDALILLEHVHVYKHILLNEVPELNQCIEEGLYDDQMPSLHEVMNKHEEGMLLIIDRIREKLTEKTNREN